MQFVYFLFKNTAFGEKFLEGSHTYKSKKVCYNSLAIAKSNQEQEREEGNGKEKNDID